MSDKRREFLWGATSSAHSVEGGQYACDWWQWEQRPGRILNAETSQEAAGHANRFEPDFALARKLGHNAHLFTLEWSRIEPQEGRFDESALAHYERVFDSLRRYDLEPVCAMQHVTVPAWFAESGGWASESAARHFLRYVSRAVDAYAAKCRWWLPMLDPLEALRLGYVDGVWPPGLRHPIRAWTAYKNVCDVQQQAYQLIHDRCSNAEVGLSVRGKACEPFNPQSAWDLRAARCEDWFQTWCAVTRRDSGILTGSGQLISKAADFLGLSFDGVEMVRFRLAQPRQTFRHYTEPHGAPARSPVCSPDRDAFCSVLNRLQEFGKPIVITGNGIATDNDEVRRAFLLDHVSVVLDSLKSGANIRGYFYRSLLDGFEWSDGYTRRFGLVHVDRKTLGRTPNPSAYLYKDICDSGSIRSGAVAKYCPEWKQVPVSEQVRLHG